MTGAALGHIRHRIWPARGWPADAGRLLRQGVTRRLDLRLSRPLEPGDQGIHRRPFLQHQGLLLDGGIEAGRYRPG